MSCRIFFFLLISIFCPQAIVVADEGYDPFDEAIPGSTFVRSFNLEDREWFGPVLIDNPGEETLLIEGYVVSGQELEILQMPETVEPGETETILVLFEPKSPGFAAMHIDLTTSEGVRRLHLRVGVKASNQWIPLALRWEDLSGREGEAQSFLVEPEELVEEVRKQPFDWNRLIIDPRRGQEKRRGLIEGSHKIALHEVLLRPEWKAKKLYIVDEGLSRTSILDDLIRLRSAGFENLYWLEGGLSSWKASGGDVASISVAEASWRMVQPVHLQESLLRDDLQVVVIGEGPIVEAVRSLFPSNSIHLWSDWSSEDSTLERIPRDSERRPRFLLVSEEGEEYENPLGSLEQAGFPDIFLLSGGIKNLTRYLSAIGVPKRQRFQVVRAGAKNPKGKIPPRRLTDSDCANCP